MKRWHFTQENRRNWQLWRNLRNFIEMIKYSIYKKFVSMVNVKSSTKTWGQVRSWESTVVSSVSFSKNQIQLVTASPNFWQTEKLWNLMESWLMWCAKSVDRFGDLFGIYLANLIEFIKFRYILIKQQLNIWRIRWKCSIKVWNLIFFVEFLWNVKVYFLHYFLNKKSQQCFSSFSFVISNVMQESKYFPTFNISAFNYFSE